MARLTDVFGSLVDCWRTQWAYSKPLAAFSGTPNNALPKPDGEKTTIRDILGLYTFAAKTTVPCVEL